MTITTGKLEAVQQAWTQYMGYQLVQRGTISDAVAKSWGAPALAGQAFSVLGPESGERTFIRFVEQAMPEGYSPIGTLGWSTTEITVQNVDQLYKRLKSSPFKILNPPTPVPTYTYLRAMQVEGPAGEQLNLTWITEERPDLAVAKSFVGRCFIAVQGCRDISATLKFFQDMFGNAASAVRTLPSVELAVVTLDQGAKIEVDQYPSTARSKMRPPGGLPPGLAMVTFDCARFDQHRDRFLTAPILAELEPGRGGRIGTLMGPSGELIELMDSV